MSPSESLMPPPRITPGQRSKLEADAGKPLGLCGLNELLAESQKYEAKGNLVLALQRMRQALAFGQALVANEHSLVGSIKGQLANLLEKQQKLKPSGEESESVAAQQREIEELWKGALESLHHTAKHPTPNSNSNGSKEVHRSKRPPADGRHDVKKSRSNRVRDGARRFNIAQVFKIPTRSEPGITKGDVRRPISLHELTPRSKAVCTNAKVNPRWLQPRTFHEFYNPSKRIVDQQKEYDVYCARRLALYEDLKVDRELFTLERKTALCNAKAQRKQLRLRRNRSKEMKVPVDARGPVLLPHVKRNNGKAPRDQFADDDDDSTSVDDGNDQATTRGDMQRKSGSQEVFKGASHNAFEVARKYEICCPTCRTLYDFKSHRCRKCKAPVDWATVIQSAGERTKRPLDESQLVDPSPSHDTFPLVELSAHQQLARSHNIINDDIKRISLRKFGRRIIPDIKHSTATAIRSSEEAHFTKLETVLAHIRREQRREVERDRYLGGIFDAKERARRAQVIRLYRGAAMDSLYETMDKANMLRCDDKVKLSKAIDRELTLA